MAYKASLEQQRRDQLSAALKALGQPCSGSKDELVERLLAAKRAEMDDLMTVVQLREQLRAAGQPVSGPKKEVLINRLLDAQAAAAASGTPPARRPAAARSAHKADPVSKVAAKPPGAAAAAATAVKPAAAKPAASAAAAPVASCTCTPPTLRPGSAGSRPNSAKPGKVQMAKLRAAAGCMSKAQYRAQLKKAGFTLESDQDVFHIIAANHGGADHPDNYHFAQNQSWNRAIGSNHDELNVYLAGLAKAMKAVAVSQLIGNTQGILYTGPSAQELYHAGSAAMRHIRCMERDRKKQAAAMAV